jgi:signal transduction histidine kinase
LLGLGSLIDKSLADVRLDAGIDHVEEISVAGFLGEIEIGAALQAEARDIRLVVAPVPPVVTIEGDRQILAAAIANLLQNAFKFSHKGATVALTTHVTEDRVLFEVEDECGGLPPGRIETLFMPFSQRGADRSGVGLGLSICLKAAQVSGGEMNVRDLPGKGCVFTLNLPRKRPPPFAIVVENKDDAGGTSSRPAASA